MVDCEKVEKGGMESFLSFRKEKEKGGSASFHDWCIRPPMKPRKEKKEKKLIFGRAFSIVEKERGEEGWPTLFLKRTNNAQPSSTLGKPDDPLQEKKGASYTKAPKRPRAKKKITSETPSP